jgi:hypothetical protein
MPYGESIHEQLFASIRRKRKPEPIASHLLVQCNAVLVVWYVDAFSCFTLSYEVKAIQSMEAEDSIAAYLDVD